MSSITMLASSPDADGRLHENPVRRRNSFFLCMSSDLKEGFYIWMKSVIYWQINTPLRLVWTCLGFLERCCCSSSSLRIVSVFSTIVVVLWFFCRPSDLCVFFGVFLFFFLLLAASPCQHFLLLQVVCSVVRWSKATQFLLIKDTLKESQRVQESPVTNRRKDP